MEDIEPPSYEAAIAGNLLSLFFILLAQNYSIRLQSVSEIVILFHL